jgi:urease accessory protein
MRTFEHDAAPGTPHQATLTLPFELRQKSRLRVCLDSGEDAAVIVARGRVLRGGDLLRSDDGTVVRVQAAAERVSTVHAADPAALARAAYHLGNRHVAVQVGSGFLRYQHDHVLDDMVRALGVEVSVERAAFEPEGGAYGQHPSGHGHGHDPHSLDAHTHAHTHDPHAPEGHAHSHRHPHGHAVDPLLQRIAGRRRGDSR